MAASLAVRTCGFVVLGEVEEVEREAGSVLATTTEIRGLLTAREEVHPRTWIAGSFIEDV